MDGLVEGMWWWMDGWMDYLGDGQLIDYVEGWGDLRIRYMGG